MAKRRPIDRFREEHSNVTPTLGMMPPPKFLTQAIRQPGLPPEFQKLIKVLPLAPVPTKGLKGIEEILTKLLSRAK